MDIKNATESFWSIKNALRIIALLNFNEYYYPPSRLNDQKTYDYVVVGGGTAGCVVANRLSENPNVTVLLIEAGGNPPIESHLPSLMLYAPKSHIDWNFTVHSDQRDEFDIISQGKVLGGTSSINAMLFARGAINDYDTWARRVKDANWKWKNIFSYFTKGEKLRDEEILNSTAAAFHGTQGYVGLNRDPSELVQKYINAFREVGNPQVLDINTNITIGFLQPLYLIADKHRQSMAFAYIRPARDRKNLDILKNAYVTRIIFDDCKVAVGVEVLLEKGKKIIINIKKEVVVSAGSINTPKILLYSGIGPKKYLKTLNITTIANLPVGRNGREYISVLKAFKMESTKEKPVPHSPFSVPIPMFTGFVANNKSQSYASYQVINWVIRNNPQYVADLCLSYTSNRYDVCETLFNESFNAELLISMISYFDLTSTTKVVLNGTDPLNPPRISTNVYSNKKDLERDLNETAASMTDFTKVQNSTLFKNVGAKLIQYDIPECRNHSLGSMEYLLCYVSAMRKTNYIYGTCPMGPVIDTRFRVKGVQQLRVVDSSTIPTVIRAGLVPAVMMLAEKASNLIKDDNTPDTIDYKDYEDYL